MRCAINDLDRYKPFSFLCLAECCTVLRSRWYQKATGSASRSPSCRAVRRREQNRANVRGGTIKLRPLLGFRLIRTAPAW